MDKYLDKQIVTKGNFKKLSKYYDLYQYLECN